MKKITFIIPFILFGFSSGKVLITDYRDAYVGSYFCNRVCQALSSDHTSLMNVTDTITIAVNKVPLDSVLQINIGPNNYQVKLKSGTMTAYPLGGRRSGWFFSTDSIGFSIITALSPSACVYKGKKN